MKHEHHKAEKAEKKKGICHVVHVTRSLMGDGETLTVVVDCSKEIEDGHVTEVIDIVPAGEAVIHGKKVTVTFAEPPSGSFSLSMRLCLAC